MRIKKYTAATMKEALLQIKRDLGDEAMILKTRKIPKKIFSMGDTAGVEVTAAIDDDSTIVRAPLPPLGITKNYTRPKPVASVKQQTIPNTDRFMPSPQPKENIELSKRGKSHPKLGERFQLLELRDDIAEMKKLLASILATGESSAAGGFAGAWAILYKRLIDSEISEEIAVALLNRLKKTTKSLGKDINEKFISELKKSFPVTGAFKLKSDGPLVIAFVGPTGAGKTTTIAKLAAFYSLTGKYQVSLITADTYRIAAIDQIRTFADIVKIGLQVVFSPEEVSEALVSCENDDIVFVDTAGRSQRNREHMGDLEDLIETIKPDETHLVLSATTKDSDLKDMIKRYKSLGANRLLFTKLDETTHVGNIFNIVSTSGIPASYLTVGQSVPDDIEVAQSGRFVQKLLERSSL